ncbi:MAG: hypothetical protein KKA55_00085 [Proteobacteria bacterium]|nr:hypothetical protein [Pseudomonadota bacterium]MBU1593913.1 hypothetical protein [Pseudomonadota bacterium]
MLSRNSIVVAAAIMLFVVIRVGGVLWMMHDRAEPIEIDDNYINFVQAGLKNSSNGGKIIASLNQQLNQADEKLLSEYRTSVYMAINYDYHVVHTAIYRLLSKAGMEWRNIYWAAAIFTQLFFGLCIFILFYVVLGPKWASFALLLAVFFDQRGTVYWYPLAHVYCVAVGYLMFACLYSLQKKYLYFVPICALVSSVIYPGALIPVSMGLATYVLLTWKSEKWDVKIFASTLLVLFACLASYVFSRIPDVSQQSYWSNVRGSVFHEFNFFAQYNIYYVMAGDLVETHYAYVHGGHIALLMLHIVALLSIIWHIVVLFKSNRFTVSEKRIVLSIGVTTGIAMFAAPLCAFPGYAAVIFVRSIDVCVPLWFVVLGLVCKASYLHWKEIRTSGHFAACLRVAFLSIFCVLYFSQRVGQASTNFFMKKGENNVYFSEKALKLLNELSGERGTVYFDGLSTLYFALTRGLASNHPVAAFMFTPEQVQKYYPRGDFAVFQLSNVSQNDLTGTSFSSWRQGFISLQKGDTLEMSWPPGLGQEVSIRANCAASTLTQSLAGAHNLSDTGSGWQAIRSSGNSLLIHAVGPIYISGIRVPTGQVTNWPWAKGVSLTYRSRNGSTNAFCFSFEKALPFSLGQRFIVLDDSSDLVVIRNLPPLDISDE